MCAAVTPECANAISIVYKCTEINRSNCNDNAVLSVDPETGAHTENIQSTWWQIKTSLPATN